MRWSLETASGWAGPSARAHWRPMAARTHRRVTSLAVLLGAAGIALSWRWADPVVGLAITAAILLVLKDAPGRCTAD
jgi:hypothetical protein